MSVTTRNDTRMPVRVAVAVLVGLVSAVISWGRLWLFDSSAPTEVLWAEDGLFPLCIQKADFWTCLGDPFAGYLLFLPRVLAWPISVLPWEYWATTSNLIAALLAGLTSTAALVIARRFGLGWFVSVAVALLPVIAPMVGLEALNAIGSSYMLLLFLATLMIALPPQVQVNTSGPRYLVVGAFLMLLTALTIPSAVVLLVVLLFMTLRGRQSWSVMFVWGSALIVGLIFQFIVAINAAVPRAISFGQETLNSWAESIPVSLLTYWPGLSLGEYAFFTNFSLRPLEITGWLVAGFMLVGGLWLVVSAGDRGITVGALVLAGLGLGLIPSAIGYANNRYFVVPLLLWGAALLVALDPRLRRSRPWILALVTAMVLLIWWPAMSVSSFRGTPAPAWSSEVARIEASCAANPDLVERPLFTPFWPPNWGDGLSEPTHPNLPCVVVWRWIE